MYSQCSITVTIKDSEQNEIASYVAEKNKQLHVVTMKFEKYVTLDMKST